MREPTAIDLCCGSGGWTTGLMAAGLRVFGFDLVAHSQYPGELVLQDVRTLDGRQFRGARVIVASPPCEEFTRHTLPWLKRHNPPPPDLSIVEACWRIRAESGVPTIIENVRGSLRWLEPILGTPHRCGSFWLFGDYPAILPKMYRAAKGKHPPRPGEVASKERMNHNRALRAKVPPDLAYWIGQVYA